MHLGERSYPIFVGAHLSTLGAYLKKRRFSGPVFIVTNTAVGKLYAREVSLGLKKAGFKVFAYEMADGEKFKNLDTLKNIYRKAIRCGIDRHSVVVALGGGVVGDIAGFFAATYMRGIPYVQVPTTLLAMVDASIGGKTGVDLEEGKNLVGAFYQPKAVWIDISTLKTLPEKHIRNGLAEVIKYGVISGRKLFGYIEKRVAKGISLLDWGNIVHRCAKIKTAVVEKDEFETKGLREILNFGHTFGHAIETLSRYEKYMHGEAVAIGMNLASKLAQLTKKFSRQEKRKIEALISKAGLPTLLKEKWPAKKIIDVIKRDKKSKGGKPRFVLPFKIGKMKVCSNIKTNSVKEVLK